MPAVSLFVHNAGYVLSSLLAVGLIISVYVKDHRTLANRKIILAFLAVAIFTVAHVVGVNIADPHLSRIALIFTSSVLFISPFFAHCVFALIGRAALERRALALSYSVSTLLLLIFIIFPDTFLLPSESKLYFPNYYVAGSLYWLMELVSNGLIPAYFFFRMLQAYRTADPAMQNRLKYLFLGLALGYSFGVTAVPLVFGVSVDPIWSIFFVPFFTIPFAYAILKYELMDIRVIGKQALLYSVTVGGVGVLISILNYANNQILAAVPAFPVWAFPLASSLIGVSIGLFVWNKLRETDFLKYGFINVVTHKFRTPLTYIKWSADSLSGINLPPEQRENVKTIQTAVQRLVDLTNLLVNLSDANTDRDAAAAEPVRLDDLAREVFAEYDRRVKDKKITITFEGILPGATFPSVVVNRAKIAYVLEIFIDNAVKYTPAGGAIALSFYHDDRVVKVSVADTGMGIAKDDLGRMFNKFFRTPKAMRADTEGLGIDLFMAREVARKHGGEVAAHSDGEGKGATFSIILPLNAKVATVSR